MEILFTEVRFRMNQNNKISRRRTGPAQNGLPGTPGRTGTKPTISSTPDKRISANRNVIIRLRGGVDRPFLILVVLLVCLGSIMVFSASYASANYKFGDSLYFIRSQLLWALIGSIGMFVVSQLDYRLFQKITVPAFLATFVLLCLVPFIGRVVNGAKRWIIIGPVSVQPTEIMKLALVMLLALYISANKEKMHTFRYGILFPYCIIGSVCFVTAIERHMSGTIILLLIGTLVVFIGGAPVKWLGGFTLGGVSVIGFLILVSDYAKERVQFWLHPENDPSDSGYQLIQSLLAIGSGGLLGVGLGNSRQKFLYLPESQNDFIFAIVCEEFGLIGAAAVILLFAMLVWRGVIIAMKAPDTYTSLLVLGIIGKVALQCIMNIAVVTGSMPVTGVSLPFFSYGGSSLVMLMAEMGMILAISRYSYQEKT